MNYFIGGLLLAFTSTAGAQMHLSSGQSFAYEFSSLPFSFFSPGAMTPVGSVDFGFSGDLLGSGDSVRIELFENNLSEAPVGQATLGAPGDTGLANAELGHLGIWTDLQGAVRLTVESGSIDLNSLRLWVVPSVGNVHEAIVPVPEPGGLWLWGFLTVPLGLWYRRRRGETADCV